MSPVRCLILAGCVLAAVPAHAQTSIPDVLSRISEQHIEAIIRKLVSFGTRSSLSNPDDEKRGIGAARRWIKSELEECSQGTPLEVAFDEHLVESGSRVPRPTRFVNVVATLPGTQRESRNRIYVVSGHYDSIPSDPIDGKKDAPGANDDASGTAVSMELACAMSHYKFDATLVFLAVAGEEQGLYGSTAWVRNARERNMDIAGMLDNDIVGNSRDAEGHVDRSHVRVFAEGVPEKNPMDPHVLEALGTGGENDLPTRQLARHIEETGAKYVPELRAQVIWRRDRYLRGGDHFPFLDAGYPAVRFTEPVENWNHQHQDVRVENGVQYGDLPEFVDFAYVASVAKLNGAVLASLALAPSPPTGVEIENIKLEMESTLRWKPNPEPDVAGYRIVWRDTTSPSWQHMKDVGNVTRATLPGLSKDNVMFGVQAYDKDGNVSPAVYPRPYRPPAPTK
jgi:hypothetical protein